MIGRVEMFGGMLILRIVAATDMSTDEADTQMHPGITHFQALLAAIGARGDLSYLVKMTTGLCHMFLLSFLVIIIGYFPFQALVLLFLFDELALNEEMNSSPDMASGDKEPSVLIPI